MIFNKNGHIDEDHLLQAIVDETDLPPSVREHLSSCPLCRKSMEQIEQDLNNLGKTARQLAPVTYRKISLPVERPLKIYRWLHDWRISFGAIATAAVVAFVIWLSIPGTILYEDTLDIMAQVTWEDDAFMTEIGILTENAMPQVYLDIIGECYVGIDDEFIQFVIPSIETNSLSQDSGRKGVKLC
ncbi:MAG: hypothetical protein U9R43_03875 [Thermodesulfobacteriota bacterium]|nr:hypothetical protein [Thermodesulfobacteriota bacterium]